MSVLSRVHSTRWSTFTTSQYIWSRVARNPTIIDHTYRSRRRFLLIYLIDSVMKHSLEYIKSVSVAMCSLCLNKRVFNFIIECCWVQCDLVITLYTAYTVIMSAYHLDKKNDDLHYMCIILQNVKRSPNQHLCSNFQENKRFKTYACNCLITSPEQFIVMCHQL